MSNKIEIIIPRITSIYPETNEIKMFADNFTNSEWNKLCLDRLFNKYVLEDLGKALERAEVILGKQIKIVKKSNKVLSLI